MRRRWCRRCARPARRAVPAANHVSDDKLLLEKLNEIGLGRGRLPIVANGAHMGAPELLKIVGKDLLEGVMFGVANWGVKGQEETDRATSRSAPASPG